VGVSLSVLLQLAVNPFIVSHSIVDTPPSDATSVLAGVHHHVPASSFPSGGLLDSFSKLWLVSIASKSFHLVLVLFIHHHGKRRRAIRQEDDYLI
jgi:hypothetical protein